jgi:hypothetical protein
MFLQPGLIIADKVRSLPTFEGRKARVFVTAKFIQPGLIIADRVRSLPLWEQS